MDDTFFALLRLRDGTPGVLSGSQVAAGVTSGPHFRIVGARGTLDWDNGSAYALTCHWLDQPIQTFTRGRGRGLAPAAERFTRRSRGNVEGWVEAWANLYTEFALGIAAHLDGVTVPTGVLEYPTVNDGVRGVRFVEAMTASARADGAWVEI
jgi:predicted dehydrogenase